MGRKGEKNLVSIFFFFADVLVLPETNPFSCVALFDSSLIRCKEIFSAEREAREL